MESESLEQIVLLPEARKIIEATEELTGKRVIIRSEPSIGPSARAMYVVQGHQSPEHIVLYDPAEAHHLNHLVAHEVGHINQYAAVPPEQRMIPVIGMTNRGLAVSQITNDLAKDEIPVSTIREHLRTWMRAVISRLVDFPADVLIERWIYADCAPLRVAQRESLADQAKLLRLSSVDGSPRHIPSLVWDSARTLDHAYLLLVSEFVELPDTVNPHRDASIQSATDDLAAIFKRQAPTDLRGLHDVTRLWASRLGLAGWFSWRLPGEVPTNDETTLFPRAA